MRVLIGHTCHLYLGTWSDTNVYGSGSGGLLSEIKDVDIGGAASKVTTTTRTNHGWHRKMAGLKDMDVTFELVHTDLEADLAVMDFLAARFLDGLIFGVEMTDDKGYVYLRAPFTCTDFPRKEGLDVEVTSSITLSGAGAPTVWMYRAWNGTTWASANYAIARTAT